MVSVSQVVAILPGLFSFINYMYVVRTSAFLKAIFKIDNEALLEVVEQVPPHCSAAFLIMF